MWYLFVSKITGKTFYFTKFIVKNMYKNRLKKRFNIKNTINLMQLIIIKEINTMTGFNVKNNHAMRAKAL